uniref:Probable histidine kinase 2 n=1 Tax=Leersia perrieri TaxID=77586 RepID=A0A0D9WMM0_9ORYZ
MRKAEEANKWRRRCSYFWILFPLAVLATCMTITIVTFSSTTKYMTEVMGEATKGTMDSALMHLAGNMQPLLEANRSAFTIANTLHLGKMTSISYVGPKLFLAFSIQPLLAQISYIAGDGAAFSYYRAVAGGEVRALFTRWSNHTWYTQAADPLTGRLIGHATPAPPPNVTRVLLAGGASLATGWAHPGIRILFLSAPVDGGAGGVVSAAVAVDDVVLRGAAGLRLLGDLGIYYAVTADVDGGAPAPSYRSLLDGGETEEQEMGLFAKVRCTASGIDKTPKLDVHGSKSDKYRFACNNFDVSGIHLGFRLVLRRSTMMDAFRRGGVTMTVLACAMAVAATAACVLMARALRRAVAREAALDADLVAHKDALRQAERKSMNKSNAFATASHDIRSSLAAVKGLIQMSRPDADGNPGMVENLNQMEVCTNKLFDILNSILDTGKVVSGKMQLEEMEFNMADVLEESVDMANVVGVNKGIEVIWDPCDFSVLKCGNVIGDSKRFKQILDNLLGNAMKFTQEGHVILRAWANRPIARGSIGAPSRFAYRSLEFSFFKFCFGAKEDRASQNSFNPLQNDPNSVEFYFEVVDTGIGIPKEKRESVFENYVQVKEGHGGTGLGLGIVQSLVRLMGGEISIKEKEPGERGTCFGFNVLLTMSGVQSTEDIEEGPSIVRDTNIRASVFREVNCFKGWHCILFVHGDETRRVLQVWMESIGMKVWMVPEVEFISFTLEKVQSSHDDFDADRCFSSKEMVNQVLPTTLRNNNIMARNLGEHHPLGMLFIVDVSKGQFDDIKRQAADFVKMKLHVPCKIVCLTDLKTSSKDFRRLQEMSCDLVLRKPVHGSRLYALLMGLRDAQSSPIQTSSLVGHENFVTWQQNVGGIGMGDSANNVASARVERLDQGLKTEDDKPLGGMHILLVEDTLVLQTIQRKMLNQLGATVELAGDGVKAVDMFKAAIERASVSEEHNVPLPYDVIFMDCQMPQMDGYEATRRIREEESHYGIHTPVVALTAHSMEEDLQKAISVGMDLHMTKPIERKRIVEVVHGLRKDSN